MPRRSARHALVSEAVNYEPLPGFEDVRSALNMGSVFKSQGMEDCIVGKYPKIEDAFATLERITTKTAIAVSRDIAVAKFEGREVIEVFYKNKFAGWIAPSTKKVNVPSSEMAFVVSECLSGFGYFWEIN